MFGPGGSPVVVLVVRNRRVEQYCVFSHGGSPLERLSAAFILTSNHFAKFNSGIWVVVKGPLRTEVAANERCSQ